MKYKIKISYWNDRDAHFTGNYGNFDFQSTFLQTLNKREEYEIEQKEGVERCQWIWDT